MASQWIVDSFNTGNIGPGASAQFDRPITANRVDVGKLKVVPGGSSFRWQLSLYKREGGSSVDLVYQSKLIQGDYFDPQDQLGNEVLEGFVVPFEDLDSTQLLHVLVTNADVSQRSFQVDISHRVPLHTTDMVVEEDPTIIGVTIVLQNIPIAGLEAVYRNGSRVYPSKYALVSNVITPTDPPIAGETWLVTYFLA